MRNLIGDILKIRRNIKDNTNLFITIPITSKYKIKHYFKLLEFQQISDNSKIISNNPTKKYFWHGN